MMNPIRVLAALLAVVALGALALSAWAQTQTPVDPVRAIDRGRAGGGANAKLQLHFIDVGEGDACLLISPNGEKVLFDNGLFGQCQKPVTYLHQLGVTQIDYQIVSHYHADHIGCTAEVYRGVALAGAAYDGGSAYHGDLYKSYVNVLGDKRQTVTDQTTITLEPGSPSPVTIRIVALNGNGSGTDSEDARSVVAVVSFGEFKAVLGGDLTGFADNEYVDIETSVASKVGQVDVYKVHSHGSRYGSNRAWIETLRPRIGIVSTGIGNHYGHPSREALERLHRAGVKTYWTTAGNGVEPEPGMDVVGGNIIVEVEPRAKTYTVRTTRRPRTVDEYPIWAAGTTAP